MSEGRAGKNAEEVEEDYWPCCLIKIPLFDTKLLVETKKERFSNNESITYDDIEFLLKRSFV